MNQCDRIRVILQENDLKQKQLASEIGVSESYISVLLKKTDVNLSRSLASLIEEKYGYSADWILHGNEPKMKQMSKNMNLSALHQKAIAQLERMDDRQVKAVLAFINSLADIEKLLEQSQEQGE